MHQQQDQMFAEYRKFAEQSRQAWQAMWQQTQQAAKGNAPGSASADPSLDSGIQRMLDGLREYGAWLETMRASGMGNPSGMNWAQAAQQSFGSSAPFGFATSFADLPQFGAASPDAWMTQMQSVLASLQPAAGGNLNWPAFGPAREHQERAQQHARNLADYMEQSGRYHALMAQVGSRAAEALQQRLADSDQPGSRIESMRGLYDAWIDAAEDTYAEVAMSDEFREIYAAMVNAEMRVRAGIQKQLQQVCNELGMPSRDEVNSVGKRLQEMRREHRAMRSEIEALRGELQQSASKAANSSKPAKSTAKRAKSTASKTSKPSAAARTTAGAASKKSAKTARTASKSASRKNTGARKATRKTTRKS